MRIILLALSLFCFSTLLAQEYGTISGTVTDSENTPMIAATVVIKNTTTGTTTDLDGKYTIRQVSPGEYILEFSYVGYSSIEKSVTVIAGQTSTVDVQLGEDALQMDEVIVTGSFDQRTKLESSVAITTISPDQIEQRNPRGTGDLLAAVPGTFVDQSSGEIGALVYSRGLASGARGLPGFHYVSLQEDGLPVLSTQYQFNFVDLYHRNDLTVGRFEGIRGGSASISSGNAPGGIFNFLSKEGTDEVKTVLRLQGGVQGSGNPFTRADFNMGGPLNKDNWYSNIGGFYRFDQGARDLPYNANVGGQMKFNVVKKHDRGKLKFYGKFLKDRVSRFGHIPVAGTGADQPLESPEVYSNFDLNNSAFYPNYASDNIPDGERFSTDPSATRSYDSNNGIDILSASGGFEFSQEIGKDLILRNNLKYSYGDMDHYQYVGNVVLDTDGGLIDFYGFSPFITSFLQDFTYTDVATGEVLFNKNDSINLIGEKIYAGAAFHSRNRVHDVINQLSITKELKNHRFTIGAYGSVAATDVLWNGDAILGTLEAQSRTLSITHNNFFENDPPSPLLYFSDPETGIIAYGSQYNNNKARSSTYSIFANELWEVSSKLSLDAGLRYEIVQHNGKKERFNIANEALDSSPVIGGAFQAPNGTDGDYATLYDAGTRFGNGEFDDYNFNYNYLSGSLGLNYKFNEGLATYARFTKGNKAPELGYYIFNFENQPISKGFTEKIYMGELGVKLRTMKFALFMTGFYSRMNDVAFQLVVTGQDGLLIFTPTTFNDIHTLGTEIEAFVNPFKNMNIRLSMTLQNPRFADFTYYNANGTADPVFIGDTHPENPLSPGISPYLDAAGNLVEAGAPSDDYTEDFSGNTVSDIPKVMIDLTGNYKIMNRFKVFANWRYTGKRAANRRNTLELPGFSILNLGVEGKLNKYLTASVRVNNVLNSAGLMNFDGLGVLGQTPEDVTPELMEQNEASDAPNPYFVRPILPRIISGSVTYTF